MGDIRVRLLLRTAIAVSVAVCALGAWPMVGGSFSNTAFADDVEKIKPPKEKNRLSISYRPEAAYNQPKYNVTLGVLPMSDKRVMKFYGGSDTFFIETLPDALGDTLYYELKASNLFRNVRRLSVPAGDINSPEAMAKIAADNGVDLLMTADLVQFNLLRKKMMNDKKSPDFQLNVHFSFVGQLIEPRSGVILWAEQIRREHGSLNSSGEVAPYEYTGNAIEALKAGFTDMKQLIMATGLEIAR